MKILLDPQIFLTQKFGGVSRLFVELWKNYHSRPGITIDCPLLYSENYHLAETAHAPRNIFNILQPLHFKGIGRIKDKLKAATLKRTIKKLQKEKFDIILSTYYDTYFLNYLGATPFILTVYDMIHETFPDYFAADKKTVPDKKLLIEKANRIVAISHQTKIDILHFYPHIPESKIDVVYLAQSIRKDNTTPDAVLPGNFILFVGNRGNYKNFNFFVETITPLLKADPSLYLVSAGGGKFTLPETEMLRLLGIEKKVIQRNYKDSELPAFYKAAKVFVFPSSYEGFGIPTLEAMACGCPVILTDSSCLPEIGGDAALYFETGNKLSLITAMERVMNNEEYRKQMIEKGYSRAKEFTWEKTAEDYFNIIKSIAS